MVVEKGGREWKGWVGSENHPEAPNIFNWHSDELIIGILETNLASELNSGWSLYWGTMECPKLCHLTFTIHLEITLLRNFVLT